MSATCWASFSLLATVLLLATTGCQTNAAAPAASGGPEKTDLVMVRTLKPQRIEMARTTTQPATVHAYYQAEIYAKVAGYLSELKADIGWQVKQDEVLAVIDVPEMVKRRERQLTTIRRLEADEKRAAAELAVAEANVESQRAMVDKARADVGKTEAQLTASRSEFERISQLVRDEAVVERLLDEAQKKYEAAQAEKAAAEAGIVSAKAEVKSSGAKVAAAEANVEVAQVLTDVARAELDELDELMKYTQLKAPFDGVVTQRNVDPGDLVRNTDSAASNVGPPLFIVAQIDRVRVRVPVPERDVPLVDVEDEARVTLQAMDGQPRSGKVDRMAVGLDENTRTMTVEIDLPNPDGKIVPGMFGQATITLEAARPRIVLPANVVRYDEQGKSYVYVVDASNRIQIVDVTTGLDDGTQIEIVAGLKGDERVVAPMLRRLKQGQKVRIESDGS